MRPSPLLAGVLSYVLATTSGQLLPAEELPPLERPLLAAATKVLEYAGKNGYKTIGVLKFRVKQGSRAATDRAGALNASLADRLELALILKNKVQEPLGIVHDASSIAARLSGANHLVAEGRAKFFAAEYPLAWGRSKATPDLFITGAVAIPDDLSRMTVSIQGFTREGDLVPIVSFEARPGLTEVLETGGSFTRGLGTRPGQDNAASGLSAPVQEAADVLSGKADHPLNDAASPVVLDVLYDGRKQSLDVRDGRAFVAEPAEQQNVTLVIRRRHAGDRQRLGVVVKVNGENTLYRQRLPDAQCSLWILDPGKSQVTIGGFQLDGNRREAFRVLSKAASKAMKMDYGRDVGTISLSVFTEQKPDEPVPTPNLLDDDGEDFAVLAANTFPTNPPENLGALKATLITAATRGAPTRGIVEGGDVQNAKVKVVTFTVDPNPLMAASIVYYKK